MESCKRAIVIGSGAAADLLKQKCLIDRLKEKAANDGLFYDWKFDFGSYASNEKTLFRELLADFYKRKLRLAADRATFADQKDKIIRVLSNAYDQDDDDDDGSFDWPFEIVDILPGSQHQVDLANFVKAKIEPLAFVMPAASSLLLSPSPRNLWAVGTRLCLAAAWQMTSASALDAVS